jgi:hypothetical protein
MNQSNFGVAVIPAMTGFFSFGKRAKVQDIQEVAPKQLPAVIKNEPGGATGVAKYLLAAPLVTSVAKYMKKQEKHPITGVGKYVLRQTIAERNAPSPTGVAKYLAHAAKQPPVPKKSGVAKYIAKQELALPNLMVLTGVAKYQAEQDLIAQKKAIAIKVQRYKEADLAATLAAREAAEAAYASSKAMEPEQYEQTVEASATTRVGRYMQEQALLSKNRPKATSVSKYINQKIILDSQKPAVTMSKVGKYLREQELAQSKKPALTGVAKYLAKQPTIAKVQKPKDRPVQSGVARYLASQAVTETSRPAASGVARYLEKQEQLEQLNVRALSLPNLNAGEGDLTVLEGEFIPANSFPQSTGVSRYLEKQGAVVAVANEKLTGVSRYLERHVGIVKPPMRTAPTGVDRYLLKRA